MNFEPPVIAAHFSRLYCRKKGPTQRAPGPSFCFNYGLRLDSLLGERLLNVKIILAARPARDNVSAQPLLRETLFILVLDVVEARDHGVWRLIPSSRQLAVAPNIVERLAA